MYDSGKNNGEKCNIVIGIGQFYKGAAPLKQITSNSDRIIVLDKEEAAECNDLKLQKLDVFKNILCQDAGKYQKAYISGGERSF